MSEREPTPQELEKRRKRAGLSYPDLATLSDVHHDTAFRYLSKGDRVLPRNRKAILRGLVQHELALRDYLLRLHPVAERDDGQTGRVLAPVDRVAA